jgi:hypothetical protein
LQVAPQPSPPVLLRSSQSSPRSTTPLPQIGGQSASVVASAPLGQQLSDGCTALAIGVYAHAALHCSALPISRSVVHGS